MFARETVLELIDLSAAGDVVLSRCPVVPPLASLDLDGATLDVASLVVVDAAGGVLRPPAGTAGLLRPATPGVLVGGPGWYGGDGYGGGSPASYGYRPPRRAAHLTVGYTGGYVVPLPDGSNAGAVDLPPDVERAVQLGVALAAQRVGRSSDVASERFGDYSVVYGRSAGDAGLGGALPGDALALLAPWVRGGGF